MNAPSHGLAAAPDRSNGVIWITGYSAAGKTTIGREVARLLSQEGHHVIFLDGDQLR
jgi:adenylylsulfate kinase